MAHESTRNTWNISELLRTIKQEVEARQASESTHVSTPRLPNHTGRGPSTPNSTASALVASGSNIRCVYCSENHFSVSCTKVTSQSDRKEHLVAPSTAYDQVTSLEIVIVKGLAGIAVAGTISFCAINVPL